MRKGKLFVVSAPAGTGKTTLVQKLVKEHPNVIESVSYTTREPRKDEKEGKDYFFVSEKEFLQKVKQGEFLEHAKVFGHYYGTSKQFVQNAQEQGKCVILVIDTQGAKQLRGKIEANFIFIKPPSYEELAVRLKKRKTETKASLEQRLKWSKQELLEAKNYDYQIINDDFDTAYQKLVSIITNYKK